MGTPIGLECLSVHFDLRIHKRTDTLEEMLQGLWENPHLIRLFQEHMGHSSIIRQMMDYLLTTEGLFHYWEELVDMLGVEILLHPANKTTPHLLTRVVEVCGKDYIAGIFQKLEEGSDLHLLCRAANENDIPLAKAYLQAHTDLQDRGIRRNSLTSDPDCIHSPTVLEHIALSGNYDIMKLVLSQGGNPRAVTADGRSLLDVATTAQMRKLLIEEGAQITNPQDHLLMQCVIAIKTGDPHRQDLILQLAAQPRPVFTVVVNTETDLLNCHWVADPLRIAIEKCDISVLDILYTMEKRRLCYQLGTGLEKAVNCGCEAFLNLLRWTQLKQLRLPPDALHPLQLMQDVLIRNPDPDTAVQICKHLGRLFGQKPAQLYVKAWTNICRPDWGEQIPTPGEIQKLFNEET